MSLKGEQLQIRITSRQKATLKRRAAAAGLDVSSYVLARVLPPHDGRFAEILLALADTANHRVALAALNDFLTACPPIAYSAAVRHTAVTMRSFTTLSPFLQNYVAAMVEQAAYLKDVPPPGWVRDIASLAEPWFATGLRSLRQHLLAAAPVAFKRRNLFVDATIGDRA